MWYKGGLEGEGSTPEEVQVVMCVCVVPHSYPYLKRACDLEPRTVVTREKCKHDGIECVGYYCIHRMWLCGCVHEYISRCVRTCTVITVWVKRKFMALNQCSHHNLNTVIRCVPWAVYVLQAFRDTHCARDERPAMYVRMCRHLRNQAHGWVYQKESLSLNTFTHNHVFTGSNGCLSQDKGLTAGSCSLWTCCSTNATLYIPWNVILKCHKPMSTWYVGCYWPLTSTKTTWKLNTTCTKSHST